MRKLLAAVIIMCILISVLPCFTLAFSGENGEIVFASGAVFYNESTVRAVNRQYLSSFLLSV